LSTLPPGSGFQAAFSFENSAPTCPKSREVSSIGHMPVGGQDRQRQRDRERQRRIKPYVSPELRGPEFLPQGRDIAVLDQDLTQVPSKQTDC
jgi:hypothetical protein